MRTLLRMGVFMAVAAGLLAQTASNQKAKQVLDDAVHAMGGDAYLQARDRTGNGRIYSFESTGELDATGSPFWAYFRFPGSERIELTKKRDIIYIHTGGKGWEITYKGISPLLAAQNKDYANTDAHSLDTIFKTWLADPKTLLLYQGLNNLNQNQVDTVALTTAGGDAATVDVAISSRLPLRISWRRNDTDTGGHYEESMVYGNWTRIGPIMTPLTLDHFQGTHKIDQRFYNAVSFEPLADSLFIPAPLGKQKH